MMQVKESTDVECKAGRRVCPDCARGYRELTRYTQPAPNSSESVIIRMAKAL